MLASIEGKQNIVSISAIDSHIDLIRMILKTVIPDEDQSRKRRTGRHQTG
jgi:hypothetical protein